MKKMLKRIKRNLGKSIMTKNFNKAKHYREMYDIVEDGVLTVEQALVKYRM